MSALNMDLLDAAKEGLLDEVKRLVSEGADTETSGVSDLLCSLHFISPYL